MTKSKNHHVTPLANVGDNSKTSKGNKKQAVDPCQISCTDSCKPYCKDNCKSDCKTSSEQGCATACKITCMDACQQTVKTQQPGGGTPPAETPCNSTGIRAPGGPIEEKF